MKNNNSGFTLIESLLVMLCISVFFMVPFLMVKSWKEQMEVAMFFNRLEREIEKTHQSAIIESQQTCIVQNKDKNEFIFQFYHHQKLRKEYLRVEYPLVLKTDKTIYFNSTTGNLQKVEAIKIEDNLNNQVIQYNFQLGSGKVIKDEVK